MFFLWNNIFRYYHDNRNFTRLLTMLSNEVVARARRLVGEHVLENLLAVSKSSLINVLWLSPSTLRTEPLFVFLREDKKRRLWMASSLWSHRSPKFWSSQSCYLLSNWFCLVLASFFDKPMIITEPSVPSVWFLSLNSKLYLSNMKCMLNKKLPWFMQSLSRVHQNWASEREAFLAGLSQ